jgi:protein-S-isoprenylcysteine O-methyltransferase Ste14
VSPARGAGANVRLVPPLVYVLPLAAMLCLDRLVPLSMPSGGGRMAFGAILLIIGLALAVSGMIAFAANDTTLLPHAAASTLVTDGPYRFSRNPMYAGLALAYAGVSVLAGSWWPLLVLPLVVYVVRRFVIDREEAYLRERFGQAYEIYCSRVRRWF